MKSPQKQEGIVLVVSLLMIAVLALLATASINMTEGNLLIVGNKQAERVATEAADRVVEETLSDLDNFTTPAAFGPQNRNGIVVARSAPVCVGAALQAGNSFGSISAFQHNYYEFTASAADNVDGGRNNIQTGVRILLNAGTCGP